MVHVILNSHQSESEGDACFGQGIVIRRLRDYLRMCESIQSSSHATFGSALAPDCDVAYGRTFSLRRVDIGFYGVANIERTDYVPIRFGSYCGSYVGEAWLTSTPADSNAE